MNKMKMLTAALFLVVATSATAGGLLTNTNQSVLFLRNPSRDAAIGIDGLYTNPAGVAFMTNGFHLSLNWQCAHQTRTITSAYGPLFAMNIKNPAPISEDGLAYRTFKGTADAPVIPSIHAAYNTNRWSFQFGFAVSGGGGKCEFDNGLGSFEGVVANLAQKSGMTGYSFNSYLKGQQYYFGTTLGAAYKVLPNLSVYGGVRMLYGSAKYNGYVKDIMVAGPATGGNEMAASQLFGKLKNDAITGAEQAAAAGLAEKAAELQAKASQLGAYELVTQGINLNCKQKAFGVAPIIGVDYKIGKLNLAAKYDFKVRMRLKNDNPDPNFNIIAAAVPQLAKFADGQEVAEDSPALLTIGAQYEITPKWRVMAGYHHFFDVDTKQYTDDLIDDTDEVNIGTEYDVTDWLQVSAGLQKTMYHMEDDFMNDISFNVPSYTFGFGVGVKVAKNVRVNAAYFQTNYKTRDVTSNEGMVKNSYTRTNRVIGLGCDIDF